MTPVRNVKCRTSGHQAGALRAQRVRKDMLVCDKNGAKSALINQDLVNSFVSAKNKTDHVLNRGIKKNFVLRTD